MKVMTVSLSPNPSPARGEGRFVSRIRDFHINPSLERTYTGKAFGPRRG